MGHGIANVFAMSGYRVNLYDDNEDACLAALSLIRSELAFLVEEEYIKEDQIESALSNIKIYKDLEQAVEGADFIIESISENIDLKKSMFKKLDSICPPHTIFASNTSSLPLMEMISDLPKERKAKTLMCHWYNPAYLIPLVELSCFGETDEAVFKEVYDLHVKAGKQPIKVLKDIPGLIANRMLHAMAREVFHMIEIGAASSEDIDKALVFGPGFRCATTGILESADMGGIDVWCATEDNIFKTFDNSKRACDILRSKAEGGKHGLKTGEGFYLYPDDKKTATLNAFNKRLITQLKASKNYSL